MMMTGKPATVLIFWLALSPTVGSLAQARPEKTVLVPLPAEGVVVRAADAGPGDTFRRLPDQAVLAPVSPRPSARADLLKPEFTQAQASKAKVSVPLHKKWWFWVGVGAGAALLGGSLALVTSGGGDNIPVSNLGTHQR